MKTYPTRDAVQPLAEREWASPQGSVSNAFVARNEWSQASATIEVKISDSALRAHFHATQKVPHPAHEVTETRRAITVWTSVPPSLQEIRSPFRAAFRPLTATSCKLMESATHVSCVLARNSKFQNANPTSSSNQRSHHHFV